jgi:hypothetical protein
LRKAFFRATLPTTPKQRALCVRFLTRSGYSFFLCDSPNPSFLWLSPDTLEQEREFAAFFLFYFFFEYAKILQLRLLRAEGIAGVEAASFIPTFLVCIHEREMIYTPPF